jgi:hypothetical protein
MSDGVSTRSPSASALAYLFANEIVSADSAMSRGAKVPSTGAKVKMRELTSTALAAALWSLRRDGLVALAPAREKKLFRAVDCIKVTLQRQEAVSGLAGEIVNVLAAGEAVSVTDAVKRWFGGLHADPDRRVLNGIGRELVELGYAEAEESRGKLLAKSMLTMDVFKPRCERVPDARPAFDAFAAQWNDFRSSEPAFHDALVKECGKGISASKDNSD